MNKQLRRNDIELCLSMNIVMLVDKFSVEPKAVLLTAKKYLVYHTRNSFYPQEYRIEFNEGSIDKLKRLLSGVFLSGGLEGSRTPDLCNANAALYQLSYQPINQVVM